MFAMSVWALVIAVINGWGKGLGHPVIPYVSTILIILAVLVAIESVISMFGKKSAAAPVAA
jgi:hypothetical protein